MGATSPRSFCDTWQLTKQLGDAALAGSLDRPCTSAAKDQWLTLEQLKAKAEAQGYKISKAKMKDTCAEIYALDAKGTRTELFLDPTNGAIVANEPTGASEAKDTKSQAAPDPALRGHGLVNMTDRLSSIGGTLAVDSAAGRGTRIVAVVTAAV